MCVSMIAHVHTVCQYSVVFVYVMYISVNQPLGFLVFGLPVPGVSKHTFIIQHTSIHTTYIQFVIQYCIVCVCYLQVHVGSSRSCWRATQLVYVSLSPQSGLATNLLSAYKTTTHYVSGEMLIEKATATLSANSHLRHYSICKIQFNQLLLLDAYGFLWHQDSQE